MSDNAIMVGIIAALLICMTFVVIALVAMTPKPDHYSVYDIPYDATAVRDRDGVTWCRELGSDLWDDKAGRVRHTTVLSNGDVVVVVRRRKAQ